MVDRNILVTGGTGFLGKEFIRQALFKTDANIYVLIRPRDTTPIYRRLGSFEDLVTPVEGNISDGGIFKNPEDTKHLEGIIDEIWHIAATTDFRESKRAQTFDINLGGTQRLLDLASKFKKLRSFNFVSTSYVCGLLSHPHVFPEVIADGIGAKNPYEESKQETEKAIISSGLPYAIFRPSIIAGSSDGSYFDNKTIYGLFNGVLTGKIEFLKNNGKVPRKDLLFRLAAPADMDLTLVGVRDACKNVITVDSVAKLMIAISKSPNYQGRIYHLCSPYNFPMHLMTDSISDVLKLPGLQLKQKELIDFESLPRYASKVASAIEVFNDYMCMSDPLFLMQNTTKAVGNKIIETVPVITRDFLAFLYSAAFNSRMHGVRS